MRSERPTGHDLRFGRLPGEHRWLLPTRCWGRDDKLRPFTRNRVRALYAETWTRETILRPISTERTVEDGTLCHPATPTTMDIDPELRICCGSGGATCRCCPVLLSFDTKLDIIAGDRSPAGETRRCVLSSKGPKCGVSILPVITLSSFVPYYIPPFWLLALLTRNSLKTAVKIYLILLWSKKKKEFQQEPRILFHW